MAIFCYTRIFFPLFPRKWGFLEERCFGVCDEIKEEAMKKFDDF